MMKRETLLAMIEVERQLAEFLTDDAKLGLHSITGNDADAGAAASRARLAALQHLLDVVDHRLGKGDD